MDHVFLSSLFVALAISSPAWGDPRSAGAVVVRTFNYAEVRGDELAAARAAAARIFGRAEIAVTWIDCRVPGSDQGASCTEPLEVGRDLMLRLVDDSPSAKAGGLRALTLGTSMLDRQRRTGVLMTVDLGPLRQIAGHTSSEPATLLGRAIAHEMGHMLLGTGEHSKEGLMRAVWSREELRGLKPAHWEFSKKEADRMRHGLTAVRAAN